MKGRAFLGTGSSLLAVAALLNLALGEQSGSGEFVVDDVKFLAQQAALPSLSENPPFVLREATLRGELEPGQAKLLQVQLFRGNNYRFWLAMPDREAGLNLNLYSSQGDLIETSELPVSGTNLGAIEFTPESTGVYYLRVSVKTTTPRKQRWVLLYAYR